MPREGAAAPRVVAVHVPELPLQRLRRARAAADGGTGDAGGAPIAVLWEGRVAHCDAAARAAGVRPGATAAEALAACGRLRTFPLEPAAERAALRALAEAMLALAPAVEVSAPDVLLLDASAAHLLAREGDGEGVLAQRALAVAEEMGYAARAAIATGRGPARALARHAAFAPSGGARSAPEPRRGNGDAAVVTVPPGATAAALAGLPLEALGLSAEVAARLAGLGVADAGALARLPAGTLAHRFGPAGVLAARLARGEDDSPLVPYAPETLPEEALDLEAPAEAADPLLFALKRLADRVAARLAGRGVGATRLRIVLKLDPRGEERIAAPLAAPSASAARWLLPLKEHLFSLRLPGAVTGLRLAAVEVAPLAAEQLVIGDRPEALAALEGVLARLAVRLGDGALFAAEPVARYLPEAAYRAVPFRPDRARAAAGDPGPAPALPVPMAAEGARPKRRRRGRSGGSDAPAATGPEPAEVAPADPRARPTRLLATPAPIVAEGEGGRLTALRVDGRARAVLALEGPERLRGEWWAAPFDRDYYRVRLDGLGDCWVFRDARSEGGRLYLHGFFD